MFFVHTTTEQFKNTIIANQFGFVFDENSVRKASFSSSTRNRKAGDFKFFRRFEERFWIAPISWRNTVDDRNNRRNKAAFWIHRSLLSVQEDQESKVIETVILPTNVVFSLGPYRTHYGRSFFPLGSVSYSTEREQREDEVSKIFIIPLLCVCWIRGWFQFTRNGLKFLMHVESKTSQLEIVVQSLAHFKSQTKVTESFKLLLAIEVKNTWIKNKTLR